jgi:excisionase family DNA binding protein
VTATSTHKLLTASDLARRWQVPTSHVYRLTRTGRLPVVRLGRYCRYEQSAVEHFEGAGGTGALTSPLPATPSMNVSKGNT